MPKTPNIIQRRELDPLFMKALKVVKHYEKAANCAASVMGPDQDTGSVQVNNICKYCRKNGAQSACSSGTMDCSVLHRDAVDKARIHGGSYIYVCPAGYAFWTSPFYSGERFAGALLSGGVQGLQENSDKVKALAQMMLICADQISGMSFVQKNITTRLSEAESETEMEDAGTQTTIDFKNNSKNLNEDACADMERMLFANLRRGDNVEAKKILLDLLEAVFREVNGNFPVFRLKAMELTVLLSREVFNLLEIKDDTILEINNRYLKKLEETSSFNEIAEILTIIVERMSGKLFSFHGVCHFSALRKAERYIWKNYTRKLSLREIAKVSGLSAPYFSTIFKEEMGENLSSYLNRLRVEKASTMLLATNMSISGIAAACGFEDQSWFSKIFKSNTGLSPGKFREQGISTR